jgi:hypothetical protein
MRLDAHEAEAAAHAKEQYWKQATMSRCCSHLPTAIAAAGTGSSPCGSLKSWHGYAATIRKTMYGTRLSRSIPIL